MQGLKMTEGSKKHKPRKTLTPECFLTNLGEAIHGLSTKTLTTFYRNVLVAVRLLYDPIPDLRSDLSVTVRILTEQDLPAYFSFRPDQRMDEIKKRLIRRDKCFAAWHEGRMVHSSWIATGKAYIPYLRRDLILESGDFFVYDVYTQSAYRNRHIAQARANYVFKCYHALGYRRAVCVVALENKISLEMVKVLGYHAIGVYGCIRFGPWQWDWQQAWGKETLPVLMKPKPLNQGYGRGG